VFTPPPPSMLIDAYQTTQCHTSEDSILQRILLKFICIFMLKGSQESSVIVVTGYRLESPGLIPSSARIFSTPQHADWLWGPPSLLPSGYWGSFLRGKAARMWSLPLMSISRRHQECLHSHMSSWSGGK
jgi:hypothetical protein